MSVPGEMLLPVLNVRARLGNHLGPKTLLAIGNTQKYLLPLQLGFFFWLFAKICLNELLHSE